MGLFRIQHTDYEQRFKYVHFDTEDTKEWGDAGSLARINEDAWVSRYLYESAIVDSIIEQNPHIKSVLELGSGPGKLSQLILQNHPHLTYHLVDKPFAKKYFEENNYKGTFFVKDLSDSFDTTGLLDSYDLVITNDFLEHVYNPHIIVKTIHKLTNKDSMYLISNPNWRMSHPFIYRGLFDFDNLVYFLYVHGFNLHGLFGSILKTPEYPRINSESLLPDENLTDWNHYMVFKPREDM
jgi:2-polyprenyl-3-methyl-5-hydroxy-6-metoxy-1,4-benzoquinol methylase